MVSSGQITILWSNTDANKLSDEFKEAIVSQVDSHNIMASSGLEFSSDLESRVKIENLCIINDWTITAQVTVDSAGEIDVLAGMVRLIDDIQRVAPPGVVTPTMVIFATPETTSIANACGLAGHDCDNALIGRI